MAEVKVAGLCKDYGKHRAVDDLSFIVSSGTICGLLGPNGAGKTTTIHVLCGLLRPTLGEVTIDGIDVRRRQLAAKRKLGLVPQELAVYDTMTASENVGFFARLHGLRGASLTAAVGEALALAGLDGHERQLVRTMSNGMKRRLNIACGIVHRPGLVIMDEPTVGIDPQSRAHILQSVRQLNSLGATIIYASHYIEEVESLCQQVLIIDHGKLIAQGSVQELTAAAQGTAQFIIATEGDLRAALPALESLPGVAAAAATECGLRLSIEHDGVGGAVLGLLAEAGVTVREARYERPSLQDVFLTLTGRSLRD